MNNQQNLPNVMLDFPVGLNSQLQKSSKVRIQISMFNRFSGGKFLQSLIHEIARHNIQNLEIQVSDSLQRHNLKWRGYSDEKAIRHCKLIGRKWASDNCDAFLAAFNLFEKFTVSRWDYWINHPNFQKHRKKIDEIFETDKIFQNLVFDVIESYLNSFDQQEVKSSILSKEFILEEIAVSNLSAEVDGSIELYPGPRFKPEEYLAQNYDDMLNLDKNTFVSAKFTNDSYLDSELSQ